MGKMTDCQDQKSQPTLHVVSIAANAEGLDDLVELTINSKANDGLLLQSQPTAKQTSLRLMGQSASADARPSHTHGFSRFTTNPGQWEGKGRTAIARHLPCTVLGTDSDNYSVSINDTLTESCVDRGIDFTRSRTWRKKEQAWVRQKNGVVSRRFLGHERYPRQVAGQTMDHLHVATLLYVNFFQTSLGLMEKTRKGSVVTKSYASPATPCERLMRRDTVGSEARASRNERRARLIPVHSTREAQSALAAIVPPGTRAAPIGENLQPFLARVLDWWGLDEEVGCGRRRCEPCAISERGMLLCGCVAPFTGVVAQEDPDASAGALLNRLQ